MRCHCPRTQTIVPRRVAGRGPNPKDRRIQKPQEEHEIQKFQGRGRVIQREMTWMVDEAMVPRVPNLPPELSARQIGRTRVDGTCSVQKLVSPLRCVEGSSARTTLPERKESCLKLASIMASLVVTKKMCCRSYVKCRNSSTGCVGATVIDRKGASDYASSFLTAFIKSLGFKRILVRSDNERSLLSLIERVTTNLTGVELVLMTSPEGDHQANRLAEVGVREIKAQTRILRSQLEQRLGSRINEKDPLMSWIPRHAANFVSTHRIMDDGRTPDQRRCGKTWKTSSGGVW